MRGERSSGRPGGLVSLGRPRSVLAQLPLRSILDELEQRSDIVLIDGAPLLGIGDAITLTSSVDALLVVARLNRVRTTMLDELRRTLNGCPSRKLWLVVTKAEAETGYHYVAYGYHEPNRRLEAVQPPEFSMPLAADHKSRTTRESRSRSFSDWTDA